MKTNLLKLGLFASILIIPLGLRLFPAVGPNIRTQLNLPGAAVEPYRGNIFFGGTAADPAGCSGGSCPYNQGTPPVDGVAVQSCH